MALKDNKIYRLIIIPICVALCFIGKFIPAFGGLSTEAIQVLFIFLGCLILWLTIGIDWPSLLCIFALGFVDSLGFSKVLSSSFGNSTFIFLLFTFICTYALSKTTIIKRITLWFINTPLARKNGIWFSFLFLFSTLIVGLFTSPSVLFVVVLPILNEVFNIANIKKGDKIAKALMMGLGFTVSISSGMTPIAHVFPILAMNAAKISVSTLSYMLFAVPAGLIIFLIMFVILFIIFRPDTSKLINVDVSEFEEKLEPIKLKDIITVSIFFLVLILWVLPDLFKGFWPQFYQFFNAYGLSMPPILGTLLLCVIRVDGKPILKIDEAFKNIPWSSLLMCAATLVLGVALTSDAISIKHFLETNLKNSLLNLDGIILLFIFAIWAALQTNLSSNMVTATLVASVAGSVLLAINSSLNFNAVICIIGFLASMAFATPPSMPHIAIVAGSEYCNVKDVLTYGGILMFVAIIVILLVGYPIGLIVF